MAAVTACTRSVHVGLVLVIYVVARYARMKTVTNVYILNLSIADSLFLVGMPMIMTTALLQRWVFGAVLCRVFYVLTCVNMITGAFLLALMSADRFAAVWFPVSSATYRTPTVAAAAPDRGRSGHDRGRGRP